VPEAGGLRIPAEHPRRFGPPDDIAEALDQRVQDIVGDALAVRQRARIAKAERVASRTLSARAARRARER
jgi:hypothetical protein